MNLGPLQAMCVFYYQPVSPPTREAELVVVDFIGKNRG